MSNILEHLEQTECLMALVNARTIRHSLKRSRGCAVSLVRLTFTRRCIGSDSAARRAAGRSTMKRRKGAGSWSGGSAKLRSARHDQQSRSRTGLPRLTEPLSRGRADPDSCGVMVCKWYVRNAIVLEHKWPPTVTRASALKAKRWPRKRPPCTKRA